MNRIYNSIWNEVSQVFVAVGEHVRSRGKRGGGVAAGTAEGSTGSKSGGLQRTGGPGPIHQARPQMLVLEPRLMFDGAALATAVESPDSAHTAFEAFSGAAASAAAAPAAAQIQQTDGPQRTAEPQRPDGEKPGSPRREVVFIDSKLADWQQLARGISPDASLVLLDSSKDGLRQMADYLDQHRGLDAVHIVSHGWSGELWLGNRYLDEQGLRAEAGTLARIGAALNSQGDILVYACNTGSGETGASFVGSLAQLTGADVAASTNRSGSGGDWELELRSGTVETGLAFSASALSAYEHSLATLTVTSNSDSGAGSLRNAISTATAGDTITFNAGMTITLTSGQLLIDKNLNIDGDLDNNGTPDVTLDANYNSRVLSITSGTVSLDGLTMTKGLVYGNGGDWQSNGLAGFGGLGGAISVLGGTVTINHSAITNSAASGGGGNGGGYGYGYGGGGGGGFSGKGGGNGGAYNGGTPGLAGGGGVGGRGGGAANPAGKGGSSVGGAGGMDGGLTAIGGSGGTAGVGSTIGGGGGAYGSGNANVVGRGGDAVGGLYIAAGATVHMANTSVTGNLAAGGGGASSSISQNGAAGGSAIGGIWNRGTFKYQSSTVDLVGTDNANYGKGGNGGLNNQYGNALGANGSGSNTGGENLLNGGTLDGNWVPPVSLSSNPTLNFSSNGADITGDDIARDGEGGSVTIADLNLDSYAVNSSLTKLNGLQMLRYNNLDQLTFEDGISTAFYGFVIKSADGSNFSLQSLDVHNWGDYTGTPLVIEAFDGGVSKGTVNFNGNTDGSFVHLNQGGELGASFLNVDEIRVRRADGADTWLGINNIQVGTPVSGVAPVFVGATTTLGANENSAALDIKGLLHVSDADAAQTLTWSQSSAPSHGTLTFNAATASSGSGDITPGGTITYTPTAGYTGSDSFTVQVSDGTGGTATRTITVTVNDVDPVLANATMSINENVAGGSAVGTISATGDTNGLTYAITGGSGQSLFTINSSTGAISVAAGADLDYEAASSLTLTVTVDDEDAGSSADATATVTVNLNNRAEPADQDYESSSNIGNSSNTRTIGGLSYLSNGAANVDVINDAEGYFGPDIPFSNFTGHVVSSNFAWNGVSGSTFFQFSSLGLSDDFKLISLAANAADGGSHSVFTITAYQGGFGGTVVAQVTGFNFGSSGTYGTGNAAIVYSRDSAVYRAGNLSFGSAWNNIDTVRFTATGGGDEVVLALDTLNLSAATPPNLAPSFVGASTTLTVDENSGAADIKSLLHASDADGGQTLTWSQSAAPSHGTLSFSAATASSGGGDITPGGTITYTPTAGYSGSDSFTVQVSDGNGGTATRTITVTTTDINPVISNASAGLAENSGNGTAVTTVTATGDTNGLNYAITGGNTGGAFAINAATGAITVANAAALDYESNPSFSLTVTVDDEDGDSTADSTATITINLSNVNEAPVNTVPAAQTFNEDAVLVFSAGNGNALSVGDVDAGSILTTVLSVGAGKGSLSVTLGGGASISGDGTNSVQIVGTAAQVQAALASVSYTPTANAFGAGYATLTISSSDNGAGTLNDSDTVTLNLNAVADTPSVTGAATTPATQSSSGLVFSRNAADGAEVSHFKITGISNGTLYLNDGTTVVSEGSFITFAQGSAGLKFTPSGASDGSFDAQASLSNNDGGLGGALVHAIISTGIAVASPTINEDSDSGAITISGTDAFYKLSAISGGTLYSDAGYTSVIAEGSFIASAGISTSVYFRPTANFNGSAGFSVRGSSSNNDGGLAGSTVNSLITVTAVNDAPTLGGVNHVFTGTDEDTASAGALVSDILASGGWADVDSGALAGLALTASSGNGSWQYSTDGTNWAAVGAVSGNSALLLSASSRLRYLPDGQNGETATLAYRAWDQSSGTASTFGSAQKVSTASNGGSSAFSSASGSASIVVSAVNDAPSLGAVTPASYVDTSAADSFSNDSGSLAGADVDAGASLVYGITGGTVAGGFSTLVGSYGTLSVNTSTGAYVYTPNAAAINGLSANGSENFTVRVSDGTSSATASYTVNFTGANDAPLLPTPAAANLVDTAANDSFANVSGNLGGSDAEGGALSYAISGGTLAGGFSSKAGSYGTLSVNTATGAYVFTPDSAAINALGANTSETFTISLSDGNSSVNSTYTVNLTAANDTPVLTAPAPVSYTDTEANDSFASASGNLAGSDRDSGSTLSYGVSGGTVAGGISTLVGVHGSLAVNTTTGAYVFTPNAAAINALVASTSETFTLTLSDGSATGTASYVVNLIKANQAPQLSPVSVSYVDTAGADVFGASTGNLAGSDPDAGSTLSYEINGGSSNGGFSVLQGLYGSLSVNTATGAYSYTPNDAAINALTGNTSETFTVSVSDGQLSGSASFTVNVTAGNDAPQLQAPAPLRFEDTAANDSFAASNGSLSASDAEGGGLSYSLQGGTVAGGFSTLVGSYGTLRLNTSTGAYSYSPNDAAINGLLSDASERFVLSVSDGNGGSSSVNLDVQLSGRNDAPQLPTPPAAQYSDRMTPQELLPTRGSLQGSDGDAGSSLSYSIAGGVTTDGISRLQGRYGSLSLDTATGAYIYTPDALAIAGLSADASESFNLQVSDGSTQSSAVFSVNISASNTAPVISAPADLVFSDTAAADSFSEIQGRLAVSDAEGGSLSYGLVGGTTAGGFSTLRGRFGSLVLNSSDGSYRYIPDSAAINALAGAAEESFELSVSDGSNSSSTVLRVKLQGSDDLPLLQAPPVLRLVDGPDRDSFGPQSGTLLASDAEGATLSYSLDGGTVQGELSSLNSPLGSLVLNTRTGAYTFTPNEAAINGLAELASVSFGISVSDGQNRSSQQLLIRAEGSNDAPRVGSLPANAEIRQDQTLALTLPADAFSDPDGTAPLSLSLSLADGSPLPAWLRFDPATRSLSGTPGAADSGLLRLRLTASDSGGASASSEFQITVTAVAPPPPVPEPPPAPPPPAPPAPVPAPAPVPSPSLPPAVDTGLTQDTRPGAPNLPSPLQPLQPLLPVQPLPVDLAPAPAPATLAPVPAPAPLAAPAPAPVASPAPAPTATAVTQPGGPVTAAPARDSVATGTPSSAAPVLTSSGGGGGAFQIAVTQADQPALVLFKGVPDQAITSGGRLSFAIPADAFAHTDAGAVVQLAASQANGQPLPGWLSFNASNGSFNGTPPQGLRGDLSVRVVARDQDGREVVAIFRITVSVGTGAAVTGRSMPAADLNSGALQAEPDALPADELSFEFDGSEPRDPHMDGHKRDAQPKPLAQLKPSGRASFSEQIRMAGRGQPLERAVAAPPRSAA